MADEELKEFHFSCGDSGDGPIGFCGTIKAKDREEAVAIMKRVLPDEMKIHPVGDDDDNERVEYLRLYTNTENITVKDIDEGE
ncbi:MAG: hypothetical protein GTO63_28860 [Anaerolineae bacterium]|nr:hypothetical protein [Anaerolineae bacterium]NIQ81666.1 hypothetical protein [Anaerolineae bacterium]